MGAGTKRLAAAALAAALLVGAACSSDDDGGDDAADTSTTTTTEVVETTTTTTAAPSTTSGDPRRGDLVGILEASGVPAEDAGCVADAVLVELPSDQVDVLLSLGPGADPASLSADELAVVEEAFRIAGSACGVDLTGGATDG